MRAQSLLYRIRSVNIRMNRTFAAAFSIIQLSVINVYIIYIVVSTRIVRIEYFRHAHILGGIRYCNDNILNPRPHAMTDSDSSCFLFPSSVWFLSQRIFHLAA